MSFSSNPSLLIDQLPVSVDIPRDAAQLQQVLTLLYVRMARAINTKSGSLYSLTEFGNFEQYNTTIDPVAQLTIFRDVYRKVFDMVALNGSPISPGATVSFPHNIQGITFGTTIYGAATNSDSPVKYIPLPYVSATAVTDQVQVYMTSTNIVLVNGSTQSALTSATIVCEYLKT
jgi:hypothetical protein